MVMLTGMPWIGEGGEQAADLAGGEPDQGIAVVVMLLACRGKLSTGAGAPFERR